MCRKPQIKIAVNVSIWYEQIAFDEVLRMKIGKIVANTEFNHSDIAQEFLHQSSGSSATLFALPTYPDPATGAVLAGAALNEITFPPHEICNRLRDPLSKSGA